MLASLKCDRPCVTTLHLKGENKEPYALHRMPCALLLHVPCVRVGLGSDCQVGEFFRRFVATGQREKKHKRTA